MTSLDQTHWGWLFFCEICLRQNTGYTMQLCMNDLSIWMCMIWMYACYESMKGICICETVIMMGPDKIGQDWWEVARHVCTTTHHSSLGITLLKIKPKTKGLCSNCQFRAKQRVLSKEYVPDDVFQMKSLINAWIALSGFQSTGNIFPFLLPLIFA
jgi:hypothetical protein